MKLSIIYGTRPEFLKLKPLILLLRTSSHFNFNVIRIHQHKDFTEDESYYDLTPIADSNRRHIISTYHTVVRHIKKTVRTHPKSLTAFVFLFNETETDVLDFYITTENGVIPQSDILTRTCIDDINSFLDHFKLCS
jgi:UDP-N-acetylglucosamine 2-epimerase